MLMVLLLHQITSNLIMDFFPNSFIVEILFYYSSILLCIKVVQTYCKRDNSIQSLYFVLEVHNNIKCNNVHESTDMLNASLLSWVHHGLQTNKYRCFHSDSGQLN